MYSYVTHSYMFQTDMRVCTGMCKLTWPRVYRGFHAYPHVCTHFIADFSVCDTPVKCTSHTCGIELVTNLYRTYVAAS